MRVDGDHGRVGALVLVLAASLAVGTGSASAQSGGQLRITHDCRTIPATPAPTDCMVWYTAPTRLEWIVSGADATNGCDILLFRNDGRYERACSAVQGATTTTDRVVVQVDQTRPTVTAAAPERAADGNGWYRAPVRVAFEGKDATSGIRSCAPMIYGGPDTAATTVAGTCLDWAGHVSAPFGFPLRYDATPPEVTAATADRAPDYDGWFNHPVSFTFQGADVTAGLAACDPVTYSGPDAAGATVVGSCRDQAGNVASRPFTLRYDGSPPTLRSVAAEPADREVLVRWKAPADAVQIEVRRAPGVRGAPESVVYTGAAREFADRRVANGTRYRYSLAARDRAGNRAERAIAAMPGRRLLAPPSKARRRRPPLLRWTRVRNAQFYNLLLYRGGNRIMSVWLKNPQMRLPRRWTFQGRRYRLSPGRYTWFVWPGRGTPSNPRYGDLIGRRTFFIKR